MDYRRLLEKYVTHVGFCEGINFIDRLNERSPICADEVVFTPDEIAELKRIDECDVQALMDSFKGA